MTQQYKKVRPSRAERARLKTRTPNIPEFTGPDDWDRPEQAPARAAAPAGHFAAPGPRPVPAASAFARSARSTALEVTQDYSYLKNDLIRITWTSALLLVVMVAFAIFYHQS
jgi:hypothetical protein